MSDDELQALNAEVCRALDIPGTVTYHARIRETAAILGDYPSLAAVEDAIRRCVAPEFYEAIEDYRPPPVSTDLNAAWLVVEAMRTKGYRLEILTDYACEDVRAMFRHQSRDSARWHWISANTAPQAICHAALVALDQHDE